MSLMRDSDVEAAYRRGVVLGVVQATAEFARRPIDPWRVLKAANITREEAVAYGAHPDDLKVLRGQFADSKARRARSLTQERDDGARSKTKVAKTKRAGARSARVARP